MKQRVLPLVIGSLLLPLGCSDGPTRQTFDPLVLVIPTLPPAVPTLPYSVTLTATGGDGSYTWSVVSGSTPGGLTLGTNGEISGTPAGSSSTFTVQVASSDGQNAAAEVSISVNDVLIVTTVSLPDGVENVDYGTETLTAIGGGGSYSWTLASGSGPLPTGLGIATNGDITGTPSAAGSSTFTVEVASGDGQNAAQSLTIAVSPQLVPQIAFISWRDGNEEIYGVASGGSNLVRLTNNVASDDRAVWSPDGSQIAFQSNRDGNTEIYVMDADGSNQVNLTNNTAIDSRIAWSPDGSQIAFESGRDGNTEIYVMAADGSNPVSLTNNAASDGGPTWSPDGSQIAFNSDRDGNNEIYVMNVDGSNPVRLTNNVASDGGPAWSPVR